MFGRKTIGIGITAAIFMCGATTANAANTYSSFVEDTESILDDLETERGSGPGWNAGRQLFQDSRVSEARWKDTGVLCRVLALNAKDGKVTSKEIASTAQMVWKTEKVFLDMLTGAGGSMEAGDDLMLVDFTVIASGVNHRCPKWNNLVFGRFSDALYKLYTSYAH
jgi:hypothetical protein